MKKVALVAIAVLGCAMAHAGAAEKDAATKTGANTASAELINADGETVGTAELEEDAGGVKITVKASDLPAGEHGIHVHGKGKCTPADFKSAGDHFNPTGKEHGLKNPKGSHLGDLPNLVVPTEGKAEWTGTLDEATLGEGKNSLTAGEGTALVVHAKPDDGKTQPSGDSGDRIACGVITK
jgi:Cu-Zn family superoxide dismutase